MNNIIESLLADKPCDHISINKSEVEQVLNDIRKILFIGYFEKIDGNCEDYLINKINIIKYLLKKQLILLYSYEKDDSEINKLVESFILRIPYIKDMLKTDCEAILLADPAAEDLEEVILSYPGIYAITTYRIAHELYLLKVPQLPRIMTEYAHSLTGIDIHPGAKIGRYFFIDHGTGIVIGETTEIGENVKIYQGVTLGAISLKDGYKMKGLKRHPTIKNNVTIYSGASILGGNTVVEDNVTIGSNVFITKSISENKTVILKNQEQLEKIK